jgi:hypothetical protein
VTPELRKYIPTKRGSLALDLAHRELKLVIVAITSVAPHCGGHESDLLILPDHAFADAACA